RAQADTNGKLSTMWSVKMQVNANGQYVAAGIGLGIEQNADGLLQSQFLVSADRFAVVNTLAGGGFVTPFVVQDGQVVIDTALISRAFIQEIVLGMTLRSETVDSKGRPLLEINVKAGTFTLRGEGAGGSTLLDSTGLAVYDGNEKRRGKFGRLS
ncbi:DUF1983 domain-containing protein, partial [Pseudomonas sp. F1002]|uniref:DUF1983 domain-containing protein n=1 Tax=Pseudomonas sp. F1002 TaxID=2738821 RepID=UPI0015A11135